MDEVAVFVAVDFCAVEDFGLAGALFPVWADAGMAAENSPAAIRIANFLISLPSFLHMHIRLVFIVGIQIAADTLDFSHNSQSIFA